MVKRYSKKKDEPGPDAPVSDPFGLLNKPYVHFGYVIAQVRTALGLTQGDFGAMLEGFSQPNIARYETGNTDPPLDFWRKFARSFPIDLVWVITGEGDPYREGLLDDASRQRVPRYVRAVLSSGAERQKSDIWKALRNNQDIRVFLWKYWLDAPWDESGVYLECEDPNEGLMEEILRDPRYNPSSPDAVASEVADTIDAVENVAKKPESKRSKRRSKGA